MSTPSLFPAIRDSIRFRLIFAVTVTAALLAGFPSEATSRPETSPANVSKVHSSIPCTIPDGKYRYKFAWNGIPSAESEVVVSMLPDKEEPRYRFEGTTRTFKFVDIFWKFRAHVVAIVDALSGRARRIHVAEQQNARIKETETVYDYDSLEAYYTRWKKGETKRKTISLEGNTIDPACLGLIICQQPLKVGDSAAFTVLVGDDPYALEYRVASRDRISLAEHKFDALRIEPTVYKIEDEREDKPPKVRKMTIWLSESEPRIPLKMRSRTFIGHVSGELVDVIPIENDGGKETSSTS